MAKDGGDSGIIIACLMFVALLLFGVNFIVCSVATLFDEDSSEIDYKWIFDGGDYWMTCSSTPTPTPTPGPPTPGPPLTLCKANGMTATTGGGCPAQAYGTACSRYYDPTGSVFCKQTPGGKKQCMAGDSCALPPQCQCSPTGNSAWPPPNCWEPMDPATKKRTPRKPTLCTSKLSQSACESSSMPAPGTCQWVDHDQRHLY